MSDGKITIDLRLVYAVEGRMERPREVAAAIGSMVERGLDWTSSRTIVSTVVDGSDDWTAGCVAVECKARAVNGRKRGGVA